MTVWVLAAALLVSAPPSGTAGDARAPAAAARLEVPVVRQARERCGPAALEMVLRFHGADSAAVRFAADAYDPVLHGALITDLAAAARRAGFEARVAALSPDSLVALLHEGVPPIVLYQNGRGPITVPHYGVVTGWDPVRARFTLNDGTARPRTIGRGDLERRRRPAGSQVLIVRRQAP